jgi:hypothetical protein
MLRTVFIGSPNRFTQLLVHWLSKRTDLAGVVWTTSAHWALSPAGRVQFLTRRLKRVGFAGALNEALCYLVSRRLLVSGEDVFQRRLVDSYSSEYGPPEWNGDSITTDNINSRESLGFLRQRCPEIALAMCINEYFGRKLREIPRKGIFLWHEGIIPEYRGLYSPFWALHNGEPEMLGYSLIHINDRYDEGDLYLQGTVKNVDPMNDSLLYIGHKAILDSLPGVELLLRALEEGNAQPISTEGRKARSYTYPGITHWIELRLRLHNLAKQAPAGSQLESAHALKDPQVGS